MILLAVMTGALATVPAASGVTPPAGAPAAAPDPGRLDKLTRQLQALEKRYGGDMAQLRDARYAAQKALKKVKATKRDLDDARTLVARMAATQYMSGGVEPSVAILATGDPKSMLNEMTLADHLSQNQAARVAQIQALVTQQEQARKEAQAKLASMQDGIKEMLGRKSDLQKLINKYKPSSQVIGANGLTSRMVNVRNEVDRRFGPFPVIGCLRPGDPQDHGTGRACDFMESTGGRLPTADRKEHGDQVAEWCIANASRLGIKYVIWRQRIYDMRSPGWRGMEDRGGITANHFDHVHVSVF